MVVHPIKRGPDRGMLKIEEIPSPVFHYERSLLNEAGELEGGRLWAELIETGATEDLQGQAARPQLRLRRGPPALPQELAAQQSQGLLDRPEVRRRREAERA